MAQAPTGTLRIEVVSGAVAVEGVDVSVGGMSAATNAVGLVSLTLPPGSVPVMATKDGYETATAHVDVVAGSERSVRLLLTARPFMQDQDQETIVATTRAARRVDDQAVPVEMLGRDDIERAMLMTPGNIVRSLDEMVGLRVQTTSPELGLTTVRMQGLRGQYTRLLGDGVPLYFDIPGGLAPVQIPPMDLERVEVIRGGASAIFGANALAGVVNLLSRQPGPDPNREFLFSQSVQGGTDAVFWMSSPPTGSWSSTFLVSAHRQEESDGDDDGWSDIPEYSRLVLRPRVGWDNKRGRSAWGAAGVRVETREGGSEFARQSLETRGADGILSGQMILGDYVLAGAGSLFVQSRNRDFSDRREHERRQAATIEIELRRPTPRHTWVAGLAADWFAIRTRDEGGSPAEYLSTRPGIFVHDDVQVTPWLSLSGSARLDHHNVHGFLLSPRGSARVRRGAWSAGISADRSYFAPTALTEETEAAGMARLSIEQPLHVETARSVSADLAYGTRAGGVMLTVFHSHIDDPALVDRTTYTLRTEAEPVVTDGAEFLARVRRGPFVVTGTYTYLEARERGDRDVALTPRHSAGLIATVESERRGRIGMDLRFTGEQRLDANPYRSTSESYVVFGLLAEYRVGRWQLFVTGQNLTDVRQTNWDPIARPAPDVDGRWTVDAWAPLEGRIINAGIRIPF